MDKYLSLIAPEHQNQPKFSAWLMAAIGMIEDAQNLLSTMYTYFDIDTAIGAQLDVLGVILNMPRTLPFQPSNSVSAILDDTTYRLLLKSVIMQAHFDGTMPNFNDIVTTMLGDTGLHFVVTDNQDMSVTVTAFGVTSSVISDLILHGYILPRPEGVNMILNISANKVFAWGEETTYYGGWGEGYWI